MWLRGSLTIFLCFEFVQSIPDPGILRVPKVYNAVITSNQNLAPSRAYPVIQPVVHRTAIGYVPPFYYTQVAPGFAGPSVVQLDPGPPSRPEDAESVETPDSNGKTSTKSVSRPSKNENEEFPEEDSSSESRETSTSRTPGDKKEPDYPIPLHFYPYYRSVLYNPYLNAYHPGLQTPGTYDVKYPPPLFGPLPNPLQPGPVVLPFFPRRPDESGGDDGESKRPTGKSRLSEKQETIPTVPPPPIPISTRKKTS